MPTHFLSESLVIISHFLSLPCGDRSDGTLADLTVKYVLVVVVVLVIRS